MNLFCRCFSLRPGCWTVWLLTLSLSLCVDSAVVRQIQVKGLQKIDRQTVLSHINVKPGDTLTEEDTTRLTKKLYKTKFFKWVGVNLDGKNLVLTFKERPVIASVKITGNKLISTQRIESMLKQYGIRKGLSFDASVLDKIKQAIVSHYKRSGKIDTKVVLKQKKLSQNRVSIELAIQEGDAIKIKSLRIIGGVQFKENVLLGLLPMSTPGLLTYFTEKDKYNSDKLSQSLEVLRDFYFNEGFLRFKVVSKVVAMSADRRGVHITIKISEGERYTVSGHQFTGKLVVSREKLQQALSLETGDVFSKEKVTQSLDRMNELLADKGHSRSTIDVNPEIDDKNLKVKLNFFIEPGRPVFVRQIHFKGNHKTADYVLRRAFRQHEGELLSNRKMRESLRQLRLMTYIDDVQVQQRPVPGSNNQVDLEVLVTEGRSTEISVAAGYGTNGFEINAGVNDYNFLGTGTTTGFNYTTNSWGSNYRVSYYDPYYTDSGIGRGFSAYFQKQKRGQTGLVGGSKLDVAPYTTDKFGVTVNYDVPFGDNNDVQFSLGFEHMKIKHIGDKPSKQLESFVKQFGQSFPQFRLGSGWSVSNYDRLPFPTKGYKHAIHGSFIFPAKKGGPLYYKTGYVSSYYRPLFMGLIGHVTANAYYGQGVGKAKGLPFYENYYAGGIDVEGRVRGYETASLGPRDSNGSPMGGNLLVGGSAEVILPKPLSTHNLRTKLYMDAGNVYNTFRHSPLTGTGTGHIRLSAGLALEWRTPLGPLAFSVGKPINGAKHDKKEFFQFTISHGF